MPTKRKKAGKKPAAKRRPAKKRKVLTKRVLKRKATKKVSSKGKKKAAPTKKQKNVVGIITHYFPKVMAAVIKMKAPLSVGETVCIKGHTTNFNQTISSMQIDHVPIDTAKKGQEIGLLVNSRVRQHDLVCKV